MPGPQTKQDWVNRLQEHGELVPSNWTVAQMKARWTEIKDSQATQACSGLEGHLKALNRAVNRKPTLIQFLQDLGLEVNKNQTIAQMHSAATKHLMEQYEPMGSDMVGFGKHGDKSYQEVWEHQKTYVAWVLQTDLEDQECNWRLRRLARWLRQQGHQDKLMKSPKTQTPVKTPKSTSESATNFSMVSAPSQEDLQEQMMMVEKMKAELAQKMIEVQTAAKQLEEEKNDQAREALTHKTRKEM